MPRTAGRDGRSKAPRILARIARGSKQWIQAAGNRATTWKMGNKLRRGRVAANSAWQASAVTAPDTNCGGTGRGTELAFQAIMTLPQPTAFLSLLRGYERECPCCRRRFADASQVDVTDVSEAGYEQSEARNGWVWRMASGGLADDLRSGGAGGRNTPMRRIDHACLWRVEKKGYKGKGSHWRFLATRKPTMKLETVGCQASRYAERA